MKCSKGFNAGIVIVASIDSLDVYIGVFSFEFLNQAIDHLRRERIKRKLFFFRRDNDAPDPVELACDPGNNPDRDFQSQQAMQTLRRSLSKLSSRQQVIFTLRHYEGLALKDIAAHLGLQTGTVKAHLHRAVTQLRKDLVDYREESL